MRRNRRPNPEAIRVWLARNLDARRLAHVLSVAEFASELAAAHGVSPERAALAGLLHDCARSLPPTRLAAIIQRYHGRYLDAGIRAQPALWHNPAAVYLAVHRFRVLDPGILRAIGRHSTGAPGMTRLDRVLFVADYCEPLRGFAAAAGLRRLARRDLEAAFRKAVAGKLAELRRRGLRPHPWALALAAEIRRGR